MFSQPGAMYSSTSGAETQQLSVIVLSLAQTHECRVVAIVGAAIHDHAAV